MICATYPQTFDAERSEGRKLRELVTHVHLEMSVKMELEEDNGLVELACNCASCRLSSFTTVLWMSAYDVRLVTVFFRNCSVG